MTEYINTGKIVATFGLKGEIVLKHILGKKSTLKGIKTIFIEEKKNCFIPWFIEKTKIKNESETYIKLEGVTTREQAMELNQKDIWLPENEFKKQAAKSAAVNFLGFTLIENNEQLGKIKEIIEQPHQILCTVVINGKEVYIPLHEETIIKIDKKNKEIKVSLPPGLLEIYL